jgi:hypothetical protein
LAGHLRNPKDYAKDDLNHEQRILFPNTLVALPRTSLRLNEHSNYAEAGHASRRAEIMAGTFNIHVSVRAVNILDTE